MKKLLSIFLGAFLSVTSFAQVFETNEIRIDQRFSCPNGNHTTRDALPTPDEGQVFACTTHDRQEMYFNSAWQDTKTIRFPITSNASQGDYPVLEILTNGNGFVPFCVPVDFHELVSFDIIIIPEETQATADVDLTSSFGTIGESETAHTDSDTAITYNWTAGVKFAADVSSVLTGIAANDDGGIDWDNNSTGIVNIIWTEIVYR